MDQAAAERKLQEAVGFTYYPVGSNENWRDAAVSRLWNHAVRLQSQLSASEERVRALAEGIRKMSRGYRNLVELKLLTGGYADNALQYANEAESLIPSPPQVIRG